MVKISGLPIEAAPAAGDYSVILDSSSGLAKRALISDQQNLSNLYKFSAYRNAALTLTAAAATKLALDAETYDTNSNFASGTYTAPVTGTYHFDGRLSTTTTRVIAIIYVNGSERKRGNDITTPSAVIGSAVSADIDLTAGDTVELWYYSAGATSLETGSNLAYFNGHLISKA